MKYCIFLTFLFLIGCSTVDPINPDVEPAEGEQKFCIIGDGGTGKADQYHVANALAKEACTAVIYVGDVIYETGLKDDDDKDFFKKFYNPYKVLLEEQKIPFYMSMGNHDWYWGAHGKHWIELSKKYENIIYPWYAYAIKSKDVCLLQFEVYKKDKWDDIKEWYERSTKTDFFDSCKFSIAFSHYPYFSKVGKHGDASKDQKEYLEKLAVGKFDVYVGGHDHFLSDEGEYKGTRLFISGSAGKLRDIEGTPKIWAKSSHGFLVIKVKDGQNKGESYFVLVDENKITKEHFTTIEGKGVR